MSVTLRSRSLILHLVRKFFPRDQEGVVIGGGELHVAVH